VCERIKTKHPDILERQADGLYRYQLGSPEMSQVRILDLPAGGGCSPGGSVHIGLSSSIRRPAVPEPISLGVRRRTAAAMGRT